MDVSSILIRIYFTVGIGSLGYAVFQLDCGPNFLTDTKVMPSHPGSYLCTLSAQSGSTVPVGTVVSRSVINFGSNNTISAIDSNQEASILGGLAFTSFTNIQGSWHQNSQRKWRALALSFNATPIASTSLHTGQTVRALYIGKFSEDYRHISGSVTFDVFNDASDSVDGVQPITSYGTYTFAGKLLPSSIAPSSSKHRIGGSSSAADRYV